MRDWQEMDTVDDRESLVANKVTCNFIHVHLQMRERRPGRHVIFVYHDFYDDPSHESTLSEKDISGMPSNPPAENLESGSGG